jgi:hypothetical protein
MAAPGAFRVHVISGRRSWWLAFAAIGLLIVARNLVDLSGSPPGVYIDEASIGYNAWSIAHFGVDEHGSRLPLYIEAFGEFKNPVYIYALVPLVRVLPLTATTERLPAAFFGLLAVLLLMLTAWRITRSRPITLFTLLLVALTPWITQQSRVGFEVIAMVAALCGVLWCLAGSDGVPARRFAMSGMLLALAAYAYTSGRLEVVLYTVAFIAVYGMRPQRQPKWWLTLVPVVAAYGVLGVWAFLNPGALTSRFNALTIADGFQPVTIAGRFLANYVTYISPDFLFIRGDPIVRHNTGLAGMLLWVTAPLLIAGLVVCWQRRTELLPRFVVLCLVLSPVAASMTDTGRMPHALRSAGMVPFLIVLAVYGMSGLARLARRAGRSVAVAGAAAALTGLLVQGSLYTFDMFSGYPGRAAQAFDAGEAPAMQAAEVVAQGSTIYLSSRLDVPYIEAFFALMPPPPQQPTGADSNLGLAQLHMRVADPTGAGLEARPGDVVVLAASDPVPSHSALVADESGLVFVYRIT